MDSEYPIGPNKEQSLKSECYKAVSVCKFGPTEAVVRASLLNCAAIKPSIAGDPRRYYDNGDIKRPKQRFVGKRGAHDKMESVFQEL